MNDHHPNHHPDVITLKVNDYEEDNAEYGVDSVGWISAHLKAKDMGCCVTICISNCSTHKL